MTNEFPKRLNPGLLNINPDRMNEIVLAYIGDAVYELYIRCFAITSGAAKVTQMHDFSVGYVRAASQAKALKKIEGELSEDERRIVKRARNKKNVSAPQNISLAEYRLATAFEALLGYLYLSEKVDRLEYIVLKSMETESLTMPEA